jgi:hypothetical protein
MYHDWLYDDTIEEITLPVLTELRGYWHGSLDASRGGNGDILLRGYGEHVQKLTLSELLFQSFWMKSFNSCSRIIREHT